MPSPLQPDDTGAAARAAASCTAAARRFLENLRTFGRDPRYRRSLWGSVASHLLVIVVIPLLLRMGGCVTPWRAPKGGGQPMVQKMRIIERKKEKRRRYILRPDSAILFEAPDLDDSKIFEEVVEETKLTYAADPNAAHGQLGSGVGGPPGFAEGFGDGIVRFIRLEYGGEDWDDGMDSLTRADVNFLEKFKGYSGMKTATHSESHPIRLLRKYPKGQAPPFVYMTGSGSINASTRDVEILREYLLGGGLLFADAGSGRWDRSFRAFIASVFPGNALRVIADDDPVFRMPFRFPNGAPPLWHHGGSSALGIKQGKRWAVFYHPGDVNDAWKSGHSGIDPRLAEAAYELGVNIVYYAIVNYLEQTKAHRK